MAKSRFKTFEEFREHLRKRKDDLVEAAYRQMTDSFGTSYDNRNYRKELIEKFDSSVRSELSIPDLMNAYLARNSNIAGTWVPFERRVELEIPDATIFFSFVYPHKVDLFLRGFDNPLWGELKLSGKISRPGRKETPSISKFFWEMNKKFYEAKIKLGENTYYLRAVAEEMTKSENMRIISGTDDGNECLYLILARKGRNKFLQREIIIPDAKTPKDLDELVETSLDILNAVSSRGVAQAIKKYEEERQDSLKKHLDKYEEERKNLEAKTLREIGEIIISN